jgi:hypothetical protein
MKGSGAAIVSAELRAEQKGTASNRLYETETNV